MKIEAWGSKGSHFMFPSGHRGSGPAPHMHDGLKIRSCIPVHLPIPGSLELVSHSILENVISDLEIDYGLLSSWAQSLQQSSPQRRRRHLLRKRYGGEAKIGVMYSKGRERGHDPKNEAMERNILICSLQIYTPLQTPLTVVQQTEYI